jgi:hypothetical protein
MAEFAEIKRGDKLIRFDQNWNDGRLENWNDGYKGILSVI